VIHRDMGSSKVQGHRKKTNAIRLGISTPRGKWPNRKVVISPPRKVRVLDDLQGPDSIRSLVLDRRSTQVGAVVLGSCAST